MARLGGNAHFSASRRGEGRDGAAGIRWAGVSLVSIALPVVSNAIGWWRFIGKMHPIPAEVGNKYGIYALEGISVYNRPKMVKTDVDTQVRLPTYSVQSIAEVQAQHPETGNLHSLHLCCVLSLTSLSHPPCIVYLRDPESYDEVLIVRSLPKNIV